MPKLTFDAEGHIYRVDGVVVPSVSDIIRPLTDFDNIPVANLEFARDRGKAVHRACELLDLGTLDWDDLDERLVPYVKAYEMFLLEFKPTWSAIETPEHHPIKGYAGTPDRRGKWWGCTRGTLDLKATALLSPVVGVQLSGYDLMDSEPADQLLSVRLKPDGTYKATIHKQEHAMFLSLLNVYNWKRKNLK